MRYKPYIEQIERYILNDIDRSAFLRLDKNEFSVDFPSALMEDIRAAVTSYMLQAYPSTFMTRENASILLEYNYPQRVQLVSGSDFGLKICYECFGQKGGKVILPSPTYAMNGVYASLSGMEQINISYGNDMLLNETELLKAIDNDASMIVLANPNQPTGMLESDDLVCRVLERALKNECWVVMDEAYYSFSGYTAAKYIDDFENLIVLRSFSKSYGIAGLRLGAILSNEKNIEYISKAVPVYNVNSFALKLLEVFVPHKSYFDDLHREMREQRDEIIRFYKNVGCIPYDSDTNFVMIEGGDSFDAEDYIGYLKKNGVLIRGPWSRAPYKNAFRVTLSDSKNIETLFELSERYFSDIGKMPAGF